jgi:hypothetical protein
MLPDPAENNQEISMAALKTRIAQLEKSLMPGAKQFVVVKAGQHSDEEIDRVLADAGVEDNPESQIVILRTFYEERDGSIAPDIKPPEVLSITQMR